MNLYDQLILRHYHYPANQGKLKKPDEIFSGANPLCGDELVITVTLDAKKRIKEIGWDGKGCAISQAAASIFSEIAKGKTLSQIQKIKSDNFLKKLGMQLSPTRMKCALLPLYTLNNRNIFSP
ncbi:iron-sulfur cluster assembly scaffold protein [Candidatus Peregrinibacteria bacterium]|nr:iron-sulfur cluster assembly scaffold protein [Candidatus Peregrinibacteria bacterium]